MKHTSRHILFFALTIMLLTISNLWAQYTETGVDQFHRPYGSWPGSLVADSASNFYGVNFFGGNSACALNGCGVACKTSNSGGVWKETVLHKFTGSDGYTPTRITLDSAGNVVPRPGPGQREHSCAEVPEQANSVGLLGAKTEIPT
jgi:hypothetical protein